MAVRHGPTPKMSIDNRVNRSIVNKRTGATNLGWKGGTSPAIVPVWFNRLSL